MTAGRSGTGSLAAPGLLTLGGLLIVVGSVLAWFKIGAGD